MKKLIMMLGLFLLVIPIQARADSSVSFDYTGDYAINFGTVSDPIYAANSSPIYIGGPGGDDDYGDASQFTISAVTNISALDVSAKVLGSPIPVPWYSTTFVYQLYSGTEEQPGPGALFAVPPYSRPVPNPATLITSSSPLTFADADATDNGIIVPFDVTLQPGTYWLAETGGSTGGETEVTTTQSYIDPPISGVVATPEQPTWIMFGLMAGFILWRRRQYTGR